MMKKCTKEFHISSLPHVFHGFTLNNVVHQFKSVFVKFIFRILLFWIYLSFEPSRIFESQNSVDLTKYESMTWGFYQIPIVYDV